MLFVYKGADKRTNSGEDPLAKIGSSDYFEEEEKHVSPTVVGELKKYLATTS